MDISIQCAQPSDWKVLQQINYFSGIANEPFDHHLNVDWVYEAEGEKYFQRISSDTNLRTWIALIDNKIVGYIVVESKFFPYRRVKIAEISSLAVLPEFRSKGVGKALMKSVKVWVRENGYHTIYVNSYIQNERAIAFYKREGFTPIDMSLEMDI